MITRTMTARGGLVLLTLAGVGEAMAAVFDITHDTLHTLAGALGILGLPIAALLISVHLGRTGPWSVAKGVGAFFLIGGERKLLAAGPKGEGFLR